MPILCYLLILSSLKYATIMRRFFVYILRCSDDTLYCGWTNDIDKRVYTHNKGKGAKYTRSRRPVTLVYFEECADKHSAMSREFHIKQMSRTEKIKLLETSKKR